MPSTVILAVLGLVTATIGTLGGIGGALLLVPVLVLLGTSPLVAAPLGLVSVAAGSLAAAPDQITHGLVHHRLGVTIECAAAAGAVAGAVVSTAAPEVVLRRVLAFSAIGAALAGLRTMRDAGDAQIDPGGLPLGERVGSLSGSYREGTHVVWYRARRLWAGLPMMGVAGAIAGLAGLGGGFIKTPTMTEVMRVPIKVAAATTTFAVGITSAAGLTVFASQGRVDLRAASAVAAGSLLGGWLGALLQQHLPPVGERHILNAALIVVGVWLLIAQ